MTKKIQTDNKEKIKLIQQCMDRAVEEKELSGLSLLVLENGKEIIFAKSGYADLEEQKPIERDTIFHLYSQSKPVTAVATMMLVQDGIVDLCEPVGNYIDSFKNQVYLCDGEKIPVPEEKRMRIVDLMNMTSGLVYPGTEDEAAISTGVLMDEVVSRFDSAEAVTTIEFAERLGKIPLKFIPGSHFCYGTSADVLGAVIEKAVGMKFGEFLSERIFEPLGMKDTGFFVPEDKMNRLSKVYMGKGDGLQRFTTDHLAIRNDGGINAFESGGAGLFSTLDDYANFARMLMNNGSFEGKELLKESAVKYLTSGRLLPYQQVDLYNWQGLEGYTYGNLLRVLENPQEASYLGIKGEYGWDGWLGTYFMNAPSIGLTFLMMTQKSDYGTGYTTRRLRNIVL